MCVYVMCTCMCVSVCVYMYFVCVCLHVFLRVYRVVCVCTPKSLPSELKNVYFYHGKNMCLIFQIGDVDIWPPHPKIL